MMYNEKGTIQNSDTRSLLAFKRNTKRKSKSVAEDIRIFYKKPHFRARSVSRLFTEAVQMQTILNLCHRHGYDVGEEEAREYLRQMNQGLYPRIQNRHAIIRTWGNSFHIIQVRFGGSGIMGRTVEGAGVEADINNVDNHYSIPPQYVMEAFITSDSFRNLIPRENLNSIMGQSAYDMTGIQNSEYLHMIAHSLGGRDAQDNLMPGYHALNTAMIPIENLVHYLAIIGLGVRYKVQMHPRVGGNSIWVSGATITVTVEYNGTQYERCWDIEVGSQERLNKGSYDKLAAGIETFKQEIIQGIIDLQ